LLRKSLGLIKSTAINIIYHLAGELPPEYRIKFTTAKELAQIFNYCLPAASLLTNDFTEKNTSYIKVYSEFKDIYDSIASLRIFFL